MTKNPAPLPRRGGSYERQSDGSLKPAGAPAKTAATPQKPAAKATPKTEA